MNSVAIVGRLTANPEMRENETSSVCKFNVAVDRAIKKEGENTADFINCTAFGKTAEFIEKWFTKGKSIGITGRIQTGSYTNKEGKKIYTTDVIAERVEFVGGKASEEPKESSNDVEPKIPVGFEKLDEEEIPF